MLTTGLISLQRLALSSAEKLANCLEYWRKPQSFDGLRIVFETLMILPPSLSEWGQYFGGKFISRLHFSVSLSNKPAKVSTAVHLRKTATKPGVGPEVILHKHSEAAASAGEL